MPRGENMEILALDAVKDQKRRDELLNKEGIIFQVKRRTNLSLLSLHRLIGSQKIVK